MLSRPNCFAFGFRYTYQAMHVFLVVYREKKAWKSNMENEGESFVLKASTGTEDQDKA